MSEKYAKTIRSWPFVPFWRAYWLGWISEDKMRELARPMLKNQYGQYLLKVIDEMKEETNSNFFRDKELEK